MNYFLILNTLAVILLSKNIAEKLKLIIIILLSLLLLGGHLFIISDNNFQSFSAPLELLLFFGIALFEIVNGKSKNASFIVLLSFSYLLNKEEYLYLGQVLIYIISTLYCREEKFSNKINLLFFLTLWPISIAFHNIIPDTQLRILFPLIMSYLLLRQTSKMKKISNAVFFAIALAQIPFLKLATGFFIEETILTAIFVLLTTIILFQRKASDLLYPLLIIIPSILAPNHALEVISILFSLKLFGEKDEIGKVASLDLKRSDMVKIIILIIAVITALMHFNNIALITFAFLTYFLSQVNTPFQFLLKKKNNLLQIASFSLIGILGLYTVLL